MCSMKRVIFHIDVNSAYLSWEAVSRLAAGDTVDLREIPSAVGGDVETRHGVILAKSIPAKKYGIVTGEPVVDALRKCPDLTLVKPHHTMYREKSKAFIAILQQYSDTIEQFSVDEAFVDMTGTERLFGTPVEAANRIREQVYREQGFTVNVGVSSNKLLAKISETEPGTYAFSGGDRGEDVAASGAGSVLCRKGGGASAEPDRHPHDRGSGAYGSAGAFQCDEEAWGSIVALCERNG